MARTETVRTIDLGYEQMMLFDSGRGSRVRVLYGAAWLTEAGDGGDRILRTGDELELQGSGPGLIEALQFSRVQITSRGNDGWLHRVARRVQRVLQAQRKRAQLGPLAECASCG
jgi:hypothetical protein